MQVRNDDSCPYLLGDVSIFPGETANLSHDDPVLQTPLSRSYFRFHRLIVTSTDQDSLDFVADVMHAHRESDLRSGKVHFE